MHLMHRILSHTQIYEPYFGYHVLVLELSYASILRLISECAICCSDELDSSLAFLYLILLNIPVC